MLVGGEPGIGKSRLITQWREALAAMARPCCSADAKRTLAFRINPFVEALRPYVAGCNLSTLQAYVDTAGGDLARLIPELAVRLPAAPQPMHADPEAERHRLFEAVAGLLAAAAAEAPVMVVLDDLQWATKPTLMMLRHVLRTHDTPGVFVIGLYRHTELSTELVDTLADLRRIAGVERMAVEGLDAEGIAEFLATLGRQQLDDDGLEFTQRLHAETAGSPFFVSEVVRHLAETGMIERREGKWTAHPASEQLELPASVREVVDRRLGRLSEVTQRLLTVAAVAGPSFAVGLIEEVEPTLDREAILGRVRRGGGRRDVARGDRLGPRLSVRPHVGPSGSHRRPRAHCLGRGYIVASPKRSKTRASDDDKYVGELASHYLAAAADGAAAKAVLYAELAAHRDRRVAYEEAVRYYEQALEVLQWEGEGASARSCDLLMAYADAQWHAGDTLPAREVYLRAADVARKLEDTGRLASPAPQQLRHRWLQPVDRRRSRSGDPAGGGARTHTHEHARLRAQLMARLAMELYFTPNDERRLALADDTGRAGRDARRPRILLFTRNCRQWSAAGSHVPRPSGSPSPRTSSPSPPNWTIARSRTKPAAFSPSGISKPANSPTRITRRMRASGSPPSCRCPGSCRGSSATHTLEAWRGPRRRRQATERAGARPGTQYPQRPGARVRHVRRPVPAIRLLAARAGWRAPAVGGDGQSVPGGRVAAGGVEPGVRTRRSPGRVPPTRRSDPGRRHGRHPQ